MSNFVHIEPGDNQRRAFARWALSQTPKLQTSSSTGTDVPVALYPDVPPELLEDAFVDGFRYGAPEAPQPAAVKPSKASVASSAAAAGNGPQTPAGGPVKKPRKRAARKPRKAVGHQLTAEVTRVTRVDSGGTPVAGETASMGGSVASVEMTPDTDATNHDV